MSRITRCFLLFNASVPLEELGIHRSLSYLSGSGGMEGRGRKQRKRWRERRGAMLYYNSCATAPHETRGPAILGRGSRALHYWTSAFIRLTQHMVRCRAMSASDSCRTRSVCVCVCVCVCARLGRMHWDGYMSSLLLITVWYLYISHFTCKCSSWRCSDYIAEVP